MNKNQNDRPVDRKYGTDTNTDNKKFIDEDDIPSKRAGTKHDLDINPDGFRKSDDEGKRRVAEVEPEKKF